MLTINRQPISNNNNLPNNPTNLNSVKNYIQQINEALNHNDKEMPIADRIIYDVKYTSSQKNYDPQKILLHIENMMINFLYQQNFFDKSILKTDSEYYKINMQLDYLTKQIIIIEQEVSNYIDKFPNMIKSSMYYKEIVNSFFKPLSNIEDHITTEEQTHNFILADLIHAVNLVKSYNKLLPQKKILEKIINDFIEYSYHTEVTQNNITSLINDLSSVENLEVVAFYTDLYHKAFNFLEYLNNINNIDITANLINYDYSCNRYEKKNNTEKKIKERIRLANKLYIRINKLDKNVLAKVYNIKKKATILKQAISQN
jgi:hypothetical protein